MDTNKIINRIEEIKSILNSEGANSEKRAKLSEIIYLHTQIIDFNSAKIYCDKLEKILALKKVNFFFSTLLAYILVLSWIISPKLGFKIFKKISNSALEIKEGDWKEVNALQWGNYFHDIRKSLLWSVYSTAVAEGVDQESYSVTMIAYTLAILGCPFSGFVFTKTLEKTKKTSSPKNYLKLLPIGFVAFMWSGLLEQAQKIYEEYSCSNSEPNPMSDIFVQAAFLGGNFRDRGLIETKSILDKAFKATLSVKLSKNRVQLSTAQACISAIEGRKAEVSLLLSDTEKIVKTAGDNGLNWIMFLRGAAVAAYHIGDLKLAEKYITRGKKYLKSYGNTFSFSQDFNRIECLIDIQNSPNFFRRLLLATNHVIHSFKSCSITHTKRAFLHAKRFVLEKNPGFWSNPQILDYLKWSLNQSQDIQDLKTREEIVLFFTKGILKPGLLPSTESEVLRELKTNLNECFPWANSYVFSTQNEIPSSLKFKSDLIKNLEVFNEQGYIKLYDEQYGFILAMRLESSRLKNSIALMQAESIPLTLVPLIESGFKIIVDKAMKTSLQIKANEQLQELAKLKSVTKTTQMLAHDVRKPFSLLLASLNVLDAKFKGTGYQNLISPIKQRVQSSLGKVSSMVEDVMLLDNESSLKLNDTSFYKLFKIILEDLSILYPEKKIQFDFDIDIKKQVKVDSRRINRALYNILGNAFEAIKSEGKIKVTGNQKSDFFNQLPRLEDVV